MTDEIGRLMTELEVACGPRFGVVLRRRRVQKTATSFSEYTVAVEWVSSVAPGYAASRKARTSGHPTMAGALAEAVDRVERDNEKSASKWRPAPDADATLT